MGTDSFPVVKRLGRVVDHPPPRSAEVKERVELCLYFSFRPSWPVLFLYPLAYYEGQRTLAKLKLNSMWGKWAQNQNKTQTSLVTSEKEFYELLTSPSTEVTNLIFPSEEVAWVSWKHSEENIATGKMSMLQLLHT